MRVVSVFRRRSRRSARTSGARLSARGWLDSGAARMRGGRTAWRRFARRHARSAHITSPLSPRSSPTASAREPAAGTRERPSNRDALHAETCCHQVSANGLSMIASTHSRSRVCKSGFSAQKPAEYVNKNCAVTI